MQFAMVKGGTHFRKQAGERRKMRKGPVMRVPVSGDIELVSETDVDLSNTTVVDDGEIPGPSNAGIPVKTNCPEQLKKLQTVLMST